jgi:uncharacterized protein YjlB
VFDSATQGAGAPVRTPAGAQAKLEREEGMTKFHGSLDELKATVAACELEGEWSENATNGFHSFHAETGEVLNWWPGTRTVQFQGKRQEKFRVLFCSCQIRPERPAAKLKFATKLSG